MLTKLKPSEIAPVSARAVVDARFSSELGLGTPAGDPGTTAAEARGDASAAGRPDWGDAA